VDHDGAVDKRDTQALNQGHIRHSSLAKRGA
jgi:hypothetical protein